MLKVRELLKALSMRVTQTHLCLPLCEQDREGGKKQKSRTFHKVAPLLWESEGDILPAPCLPSAPPPLPEDLLVLTFFRKNNPLSSQKFGLFEGGTLGLPRMLRETSHLLSL